MAIVNGYFAKTKVNSTSLMLLFLSKIIIILECKAFAVVPAQMKRKKTRQKV